jgi:hypothetical protein
MNRNIQRDREEIKLLGDPITIPTITYTAVPKEKVQMASPCHVSKYLIL